MPGKWVALWSLLLFGAQAAEDRIWIEIKIDGLPARMFLDTGASEFYLFRPAAERFGLEFDEPAGSDWEMYRVKNEFAVELPGFRGKVRPVIVEPPAYIPVKEIDGFVGWKMVRNNVWQIDAANNRIIMLSGSVKPAGWTRLKLRETKPSGAKRWGILAFELPSKEIVLVDTGQDSGVGLPGTKWAEWKAAHPRQPIRKVKLAMPTVGIVEREQSFADELQLGPIRMTSVVVQEAEPWSESMGKSRFGGTLGLAALRRLSLIVDGKNDAAYVQPKN